MFTLHTDAKFDDLENLIARIERPGNGQSRMIADGITQRFQENFTRQGSGSGAWAPLAPSTVLQRRALGYASNSPILVRSGRLRKSFVERGGDHYERIWQSPAGLTVEVGSNDPRAIFHERGTSRMPQRSVTLLDDGQENRLADLIEYVIGQIERQAGW